MKLFRSEEEILQENKEKQEAEEKLREFYKDINIIISEEDLKILEQIRKYSKREIKDSFKTISMSGDILLNETISKSIFLEFYILKQLSSNRKAIDTLIEQNEELNNKFDQLIEILKSK